MNLRGIWVASVVVGLALCACGKKEKPPEEWDTFTYDDDGFSVRAPIKPDISHETVTTALGPAPSRQYVCNSSLDKALIVMVSDVGLPAGIDVEQVVRNVAEAGSDAITGEVKRTDSITAAGAPGVEYEVVGDAENIGRVELVSRVYFKNNRLYQILTMYPDGDEKSYREKGAAFLASFRFTDDPAATDEDDGDEGGQ